MSQGIPTLFVSPLAFPPNADIWLDRGSLRPQPLAGCTLSEALLCPCVSGLLQITLLAQLYVC